jgi:ankyrin repeat protein
MGETALYQAVEMENVKQILTLLENKADPNIAQYDGFIPLHIAVQKQNIKIVENLLIYGSNPNYKNKHYYQTPVHFAIKYNVKPAIFNLLLQYGGNLGIRDKNNKRPIDYICSGEMSDIIINLKLHREDIFRTPSKLLSSGKKRAMSDGHCNTPYDNRVFTIENHFDSFVTKEIPISERNPLDTIK